MENTIYLEDILKSFKPKRNVLVMLSSAHAIFGEENEAPMYIGDSAGNHYAENWLTAIKRCRLEKTFIVRAETEETSLTNDQVTIYLQNAKYETSVARLDLMANEVAVASAFA